MTPGQYVIASLFVVIGACVQGTLGFGLGLIAAPVLAFIDRASCPRRC